jgi:hypothetical protein
MSISESLPEDDDEGDPSRLPDGPAALAFSTLFHLMEILDLSVSQAERQVREYSQVIKGLE